MKPKAMVKKVQASGLCCLCKGTGFEIKYTDNQAVCFTVFRKFKTMRMLQDEDFLNQPPGMPARKTAAYLNVTEDSRTDMTTEINKKNHLAILS